MRAPTISLPARLIPDVRSIISFHELYHVTYHLVSMVLLNKVDEHCSYVCAATFVRACVRSRLPL